MSGVKRADWLCTPTPSPVIMTLVGSRLPEPLEVALQLLTRSILSVAVIAVVWLNSGARRCRPAGHAHNRERKQLQAGPVAAETLQSRRSLCPRSGDAPDGRVTTSARSLRGQGLIDTSGAGVIKQQALTLHRRRSHARQQPLHGGNGFEPAPRTTFAHVGHPTERNNTHEPLETYALCANKRW